MTHAAAPALEGLPAPAAPAPQPTPPSGLANGTATHMPEAPPAAAAGDMTPVPPVTGIAAVANPVAGVSPRRPSDGSFCAPEAIRCITTDGDSLSPNKVRLPAAVLQVAKYPCNSAKQRLVVFTPCAQKSVSPVTKVVCREVYYRFSKLVARRPLAVLGSASQSVLLPAGLESSVK